jgi:hypothetical protein
MKLATSGRHLQTKKDRGRLVEKNEPREAGRPCRKQKILGVKNNDRKRIFKG